MARRAASEAFCNKPVPPESPDGMAPATGCEPPDASRPLQGRWRIVSGAGLAGARVKSDVIKSDVIKSGVIKSGVISARPRGKRLPTLPHSG